MEFLKVMNIVFSRVFRMGVICLLFIFWVASERVMGETKTLRVEGVDFVYRVPEMSIVAKMHGDEPRSTRESKASVLKKDRTDSLGVMVLVGGRDWSGDKTMKAFSVLHEFADREGVLLVAPSFSEKVCGKDYWEPERGMGSLLHQALNSLRKDYKLKESPILMYGYSAGGQFTSLYVAQYPHEILAWAVHGCGVYPIEAPKAGPPALITCGREEMDRWRISRHYAYRYREAGGSLLLLPRPGGHELLADDLNAVVAFFSTQLSIQAKTGRPTEIKRDVIDGAKSSPQSFVGEDDTGRVVPVERGEEIEVEFRNLLYADALKDMWMKNVGPNSPEEGRSVSDPENKSINGENCKNDHLGYHDRDVCDVCKGPGYKESRTEAEGEISHRSTGLSSIVEVGFLSIKRSIN